MKTLKRNSLADFDCFSKILEYLLRLGLFADNCSWFSTISPDFSKDYAQMFTGSLFRELYGRSCIIIFNMHLKIHGFRCLIACFHGCDCKK